MPGLDLDPLLVCDFYMDLPAGGAVVGARRDRWGRGFMWSLCAASLLAVRVAVGRNGEPVAGGVGVQGELSIVETRVTPFAVSLPRQRTVSSRDHEKFRSL